MNEAIKKKYEHCKELIRSYESVAVAFSGGVDSSLVLHIAHDVLGKNACAFSAISPASPQNEDAQAALFCQERGIEQVRFQVDELVEIKGFDHNPPERCYLCKHSLFSQIKDMARARGIAHICEGSNVDDYASDRPGLRALVELSVVSPLYECGFTKSEVRTLAKKLHLRSWGKPSLACLYTRFPFGEHLTPEKLQRVDAAEKVLLERGFKTVRVRVDGSDARIEVAPDEIERLQQPSVRDGIVARLQKLGYQHICVDPRGYTEYKDRI